VYNKNTVHTYRQTNQYFPTYYTSKSNFVTKYTVKMLIDILPFRRHLPHHK